MGGRGGSSGRGGGGGSGRSPLPPLDPQFTDGSEKQKAWAERILEGFDQQLAEGEHTYSEYAQSIGDPSYLQAWDASSFSRSADEVHEMRVDYRTMVMTNPQFHSSVYVINNRHAILEGLLQQASDRLYSVDGANIGRKAIKLQVSQ